MERQWYGRAHWLYALLPLSAIFTRLARWRRKRLCGASVKLKAPVIVVGNISVGGTGKTPVLLSLVGKLQAWGYSPGVVSRGYGGTHTNLTLVTEAATTAQVGDEPLLIQRSLGVPVMVGRDRARAALRLQQEYSCDVIISDDGLQHYRLARDIEWAVVDAERGLGNGYCLPLGPLREPPARLAEVHAVLLNGEGAFTYPGAQRFTLRPSHWQNVADGDIVALAELDLHNAAAIAGIGNPVRFFNSLRSLGFTGATRAFADHHPYQPADLAPFAGQRLLMTTKDAVKCAAFAGDDAWALVVSAELPPALLTELQQQLQQLAV